MSIISSSYSPDSILNALDASIDHVHQNIRCYCHDPLSDFTRNRKWDFPSIVRFLIQMGSKSMKSELCEYFQDFSSLTTDSALYQQRIKLLPEALERVLYLFTHSFHHPHTIKGHHLLAADGSDVNISYDPLDTDTLCLNGSHKPFNQFHINALYDCLNHIYWDLNIDTASKTREQDALKEMIVDHNYPIQSILTADRGYEGYDLIACCQKNHQKFVFRVKDKDGTGILRNTELPEGEFDMDVHKIITRKQTKETKANKLLYTILTNSLKFTYLDITEDSYEMDFRVVCFKITEDTYEYLITNLSRDEFSISDLKELYH